MAIEVFFSEANIKIHRLKYIYENNIKFNNYSIYIQLRLS
jgi:hypothetical protein